MIVRPNETIALCALLLWMSKGICDPGIACNSGHTPHRKRTFCVNWREQPAAVGICNSIDPMHHSNPSVPHERSERCANFREQPAQGMSKNLGLCHTNHCLDWNDIQAPHKQQPSCVNWREQPAPGEPTCAVEGCGRTQYQPEHNRSREYFQHYFVPAQTEGGEKQQFDIPHFNEPWNEPAFPPAPAAGKWSDCAACDRERFVPHTCKPPAPAGPLIGIDWAKGPDKQGYFCTICGPSDSPCEHYDTGAKSSAPAAPAREFYKTAGSPCLGISGAGGSDTDEDALERVFKFAEAYAAERERQTRE